LLPSISKIPKKNGKKGLDNSEGFAHHADTIERCFGMVRKTDSRNGHNRTGSNSFVLRTKPVRFFLIACSSFLTEGAK
jgi:hypothetical protein